MHPILGKRVRDVLTGFTGVACAYTEWMTGCNRITIEPTELKDGKLQMTETFDESRVEQIEGTEFVPAKAKQAPGGPTPRIPQKADPQ